MMTQTHGLIAAALFASPSRSRFHNSVVLLGSLAPDLAIFALFFWSKVQKIPEKTLWQDLYFSEPMLTVTAITNSLPLYFFVLLIALLISLLHDKPRNAIEPPDTTLRATRLWQLISRSALALFAFAAITHLFGDFPVHAADAHPHFWPFSDWRFHSPVSYWDHRPYGNVFSYAEAVLGIALSVIIFRRFRTPSIRALVVLTMCAYVAVPLYFSL